MLINEYRGTRRTLAWALLPVFALPALGLAAAAVCWLHFFSAGGATPERLLPIALGALAVCLLPLAISGGLRLRALPQNRRFRRLMDEQLARTGSDLVREFEGRRVIDRNRGPIPYTCITDNWLITVGIAGVHRDFVEGMTFTARNRRFRRRFVETRVVCSTSLFGGEEVVFRVAHPRQSNEVQAIVDWYMAGNR